MLAHVHKEALFIIEKCLELSTYPFVKDIEHPNYGML